MLGFAFEECDIHRSIVIVGNEGGGRGKIASTALRAPICEKCCFYRVSCQSIGHTVAQAFNSFFVPAQLGGHAGHAGAAETVQHNVAWFGVVQDVAHNGFMRHLGVVRVGIVNRVVLAFRDIRGERLAVIFRRERSPCSCSHRSLFSLLPFLDDLAQEGVGAGGVVGRVGERQDGIILTNGEAFDLTGGRVCEEGVQARSGRHPFWLAVRGWGCMRRGLRGSGGVGKVCYWAWVTRKFAFKVF